MADPHPTNGDPTRVNGNSRTDSRSVNGQTTTTTAAAAASFPSQPTSRQPSPPNQTRILQPAPIAHTNGQATHQQRLSQPQLTAYQQPQQHQSHHSNDSLPQPHFQPAHAASHANLEGRAHHPPPAATSVSTSPLLVSPTRRVLVTGGSGFLGRHLIQTLLGLGHEIRCFDIVQTSHDSRVTFYQGDLTLESDQELLSEACMDCDTVFHTASLTDPLAPFPLMWNVNVVGTRQVIQACIQSGVRNLIFTSTTAVIFNGCDIEGATEEECPYPTSYLDPYSQCKAEAERLVIAANGSVSPLTGQQLCTVSLRPHAIFGPRDTHFISKLIARARGGEITHMIGSGTNKVDFTYVGNVIHAMVITMHQLSDPTTPVDEEMPAEYMEARKRCGGQCYFITNGEPRPFWQFINTILNETGCIGPTKKISFSIAYFIASIMEWIQWIRQRLPSFLRFHMEATITRHMVCIMGKHQWYSIGKATRDLSYHPIISMDQGLETTINYFFRRKNVKLWNAHPTTHLQMIQHQQQHQANPSSHTSLHPPRGITPGLTPVGSAPKLLTRIHSVPTPTPSIDQQAIDSSSNGQGQHLVPATSTSSSHLRPPSNLHHTFSDTAQYVMQQQLQHQYQQQQQQQQQFSPPTTSLQHRWLQKQSWPQNTTPPFESQLQPQLSTQQLLQPPSSYPSNMLPQAYLQQQPYPTSRQSLFHPSVTSPANGYYSTPDAPQPARPLQQVPRYALESSIFLNAYGQPSLPSISPPYSINSNTATPANHLLSSSPPTLQSSSTKGDPQPSSDDPTFAS